MYTRYACQLLYLFLTCFCLVCTFEIIIRVVYYGRFHLLIHIFVSLGDCHVHWNHLLTAFSCWWTGYKLWNAPQCDRIRTSNWTYGKSIQFWYFYLLGKFVRQTKQTNKTPLLHQVNFAKYCDSLIFCSLIRVVLLVYYWHPSYITLAFRFSLFPCRFLQMRWIPLKK